ncbi:glycogen debranching protein GlgX [Parachitinimonas caeni]|uniref:Glycogen debranching protein GlgX n=1 Tax=Parachitinimonas caeni TaxID=3031301 RepID=A0ABT7E5D7_9NEIS|nr:glycogen debranching protein GlgX [Parachitinimonas caeni]MDK2126578.1 glycogen debranching protein GlgX [Parachitinimonas caeni]
MTAVPFLPARLETGRPYPLGATLDSQGANFALFSDHATAVELCLFDASGQQELARLPLPAHSNGIWYGFLPGATSGLVYGYRVYGPWAPALGHRFNPAKLLLDPYAREIVGQFAAERESFGGLEHDADQPDPRDNARVALKARLVADTYDWGDDAAPRIPLADTVIYEAHVRGLSQLHPALPEPFRGTYAALTKPALLDHLSRLGITSLSLLPIHQHADEPRLTAMGLHNYWGYNTIGFFAVEPTYGSGQQPAADEFRDMVKALHARGIEVLLDVVYNHTAEADECGPMLSFKGIDNASYYHLDPTNKARYLNHTGCGNSLNLAHPRVLQLVLDSLRFWVTEMHIDGFRFDLAPELARNPDFYDATAPFFAALQQDPVLSQVKLIAEPWDIGPEGYRLGQFPAGWSEWNDQFRDTLRAFWLHQWPSRGEFARRFAASSDIFQQRGRLPTASINYLTAHDGFTLADLVAYNHKHNHANGEDNRDGHNHNHSWNCGVEGPTDDATVLALRGKLKRALLASLLMAQGTPMLLAGDEIGHSQGGNNNAYCQDNPTTWLDWAQADADLLAYVQRLLALRRDWPTLRHAIWYSGPSDNRDEADLLWLNEAGNLMTTDEWQRKDRFCLGIRLRGMASPPCLILINAEAQPVTFSLPAGSWQVLLASEIADGVPLERRVSDCAPLPAHSLWLLVPAKLC